MHEYQSTKQCCIFRSIPAGTDGKSRTNMQTGTSHPMFHLGQNFGLFQPDYIYQPKYFFGFLFLFFFSASSASASASASSSASTSSSSASASSTSALLLLLLLLCFFFFFFRPTLSLFLYLWWTAQRTAITLQLAMKTKEAFNQLSISL